MLASESFKIALLSYMLVLKGGRRLTWIESLHLLLSHFASLIRSLSNLLSWLVRPVKSPIRALSA